MTAQHPHVGENDIAIIGMALRFPGARKPGEYWRNLRDGITSIKPLNDDELQAAGVSTQTLKDPHYVKAAAVLQDLEEFDADFFGLSPKEAAIMDPQHRHFLECSWEALEDAGYPPETFDGSIGVYGGCGMGSYFMFNILSNPELVESVGLFLLRHTGNDKDFLCTRVSYVFDLKGPSVNIQTACSTSLVAVHAACQSLLNGECDLALAGGVTIEIPHGRGYHFQEGEILSPEGRCRAFDHRAQGTVFGSGAGAVVLRPLAEALESGDHIYATIKGSAVNNDGASKIGYLAPSVDGQAAAVVEALAVAGISADTIGYVECHGTGTPMGDPIEIAALTRAFRETTERQTYCGIGSVKTNIGHLDTAAGVASLIKATLALSHRQLPPSLNYEAPNPKINFADSPFYVNARLEPWQDRAGSENTPRRAAVNSLGVGGTNAFVILEEAPPVPSAATSRRTYQLLVLSARNRTSLDGNAGRLAAFLRENPETSLADVAFTLRHGRRAFDYRRVLACRNHEEAADFLETADPLRVFTHQVTEGQSSVVFMFPGGGSQYWRMGRELYDAEPLFREEIDRGLEKARALMDDDLGALIFADEARAEEVEEAFQRPSLQLPVIFIVEYALAKLWMSWGVKPSALIGHSLGENTAACLAGVFSYEDALGLVALRGQLFEKVPEGGLLSVQLPREQLSPLLGNDLDLAVVNSPEFCVVSGPNQALDRLIETLNSQGIESDRVRISIAAHSRLLEPILEPFGNYLRGIRLFPPNIPFISNRTGTWIGKEQATDPEYWVGHLRHTVLFGQGIATLLREPGRIFIEAGPGKTLCSLARQQPGMQPAQGVIPSLRHPREQVSDEAFFITSLGRAWATGAPVDLDRLQQGEKRKRVSLPTYAFRHQRYWIEPGETPTVLAEDKTKLLKLKNMEDWYFQPVWKKRAPATPGGEDLAHTWLVFQDDTGLGKRIVTSLRQRGHDVIVVREADAYRQIADNEFVLSPERGQDDYHHLVQDLVTRDKIPSRVAHLWMVTGTEKYRPGSSFFHRNQERGFYSLFFLAKAVADENAFGAFHLTVVANSLHKLFDEPLPYPEKATLLGPCRVLPHESPGVTCAGIDCGIPHFDGNRRLARRTRDRMLDQVAGQLMEDFLATPANADIAYRDGIRYEMAYAKLDQETTPPESVGIRQKGVYLITGGLGGLGLATADYLAREFQARLILLSRTGLPPEQEWDEWREFHGPENRVVSKINQLRRLKESGTEYLVVAVDVTDVEAMQQVLERANRRFGRIHGVFHTAGVINDSLIPMKTQSDVEDVFTPKVHGTLVLNELLGEGDLDFIVLFSSTSTAIAPPGQVDYVAANAFLNAYAQSRAVHKKPRTIAVNWGVWKQVGMAAETAQRGSREAYSGTQVKSTTSHPLFDGKTTDSHGFTILSAWYRPNTHWILDEHRTKAGHALVPGTGYLELARAALLEQGETRPFEIGDLFFFRPLAVADEETKEVRVKLKPGQSGYVFEVQSKRVFDDGREGWETHAQAKLTPYNHSRPRPIPLADIEARCGDLRTTDDDTGLHLRNENNLRFGPRWAVLRQAAFGNQEALAELEIPERFKGDLKDYGLHPALLDIATSFGLEMLESEDPAAELWVPVSYRSVRMRRPLQSRIRSWTRLGEQQSEDIARFNLILSDETGNVLVEIEDFTMKRLYGDLEFALAPPPSLAEMEFEDQTGEAQGTSSPAERAFRHNLAQGILPQEGMAALTHILNGPPLPQVVVTSLDLPALRKQTEEMATQAGKKGAKFNRPELESEYLEPRDDIERTLAGLWEELLGVDTIGVHDNFFELGGHSLIAVRLFAQIKKTYHVEYPISVLFEAPTVERCASMIRETTGAQEDESGAPTAPRRKHTHLVAMHAGKGGPKTPFFLVAGMFGNVLNLRHLAHLIGTDRHFYGLQARGLYGDDEPHHNFEDMAADYIAEIRTVQAQGPYLLGGFSGGGITAYEMARQLRAEGEAVDLLVFFDTPLPQRPSLTRKDKLKMHWLDLKRKGLRHITEWTADRYEWEMKRWRARFGRDDETELDASDFHSKTIEAAFREALVRYDLQPYPGKLALFRPKLDRQYVLGPDRVVSAEKEFVFHDNGWTPYVEKLDIYEVPGNHDSMVLEPNVRVLAGKLKECIHAAEEEPQVPFETAGPPRVAEEEEAEPVVLTHTGPGARD